MSNMYGIGKIKKNTHPLESRGRGAICVNSVWEKENRDGEGNR